MRALLTLGALLALGSACGRAADHGVRPVPSRRGVSIEGADRPGGDGPPIAITERNGRLIGVVSFRFDEPNRHPVLADSQAAAAERRRRERLERRRDRLAARYGCRVERSGIAIPEDLGFSSCYEPFGANAPNWNALAARFEEALARPPAEVPAPGAIERCVRSVRGGQWSISARRQARRAVALVGTPRCPLVTPAALRYSAELGALIDSLRLIARARSIDAP